MKADAIIGAVVELQSGGGKMTVVGGPDSDGLLECASYEGGVQYARLPPTALRFAPSTSEEAIVFGAIETLRDAFKLRPDCDRVDYAAEDAVAEYRAYRQQTQEHVCPPGLLERRQQAPASAWKAKAHNNPDALEAFLGALRGGQDGDLRARAADLLEAFAR